MLVALLFGWLNGLLVGKLNLPPFIATLGMQFISLGICSVVAKVQTQTYPSLKSADGWFKQIIYKYHNFPVGAIWLVVFFIIGWILLNKTILGRYTYAMGSNEDAVELSGIQTSKWKTRVYVVNGFFVGLAGIIYAATYSTITPQTGNGQEMYAIAACVIGGTSLAGGVGTISGTILGVFVISVLKTGLLSIAAVFAKEFTNTSSKEMDIRIIAKSFNNQFYQAAFKGAADAAAKLGVKITTNGPDVETNTSQQVEQVKAAVNAHPDAIVLAACDTASLEETLDSAKEAGIPVIGFDSGVPGDTTGAVLATAATDNFNAGGNVAANLIADAGFQAAILKGTEKAPTVLAVLAQDATSGSIVLRVDGFIARALAALEALEGLAGSVSVSGQERWTKRSQRSNLRNQ